jgi:hypothetical protein
MGSQVFDLSLWKKEKPVHFEYKALSVCLVHMQFVMAQLLRVNNECTMRDGWYVDTRHFSIGFHYFFLYPINYHGGGGGGGGYLNFWFYS